MQQSVQTQPIDIEGIRRQFAGKFTEFLLDLLGDPHIEDAFHQGLDGEQMCIDVLQISHGLMQRIGSFFRVDTWRGWGSTRIRLGPDTMLLLQILEHTARQGPERLKSSPIEFLLLTQGGELTNEAVVFSVEPLTVRALTRLFRHCRPSISDPLWHPSGGERPWAVL